MKKISTTISSRKIAGMAVLSALAVVLAVVWHIPIFPAVPFLEYDLADVPIFLSAFMYGPWSALIITIIVCIIQGTTVSASSGFIGILMHILATGSYVLVSGLIYKKWHTFKGAMVAMSAGVLTWIVLMAVWNIIFTPIFMGVPRAVVLDLFVWIILFNLVKVGLNTFCTAIMYKRLHILFESAFKKKK